MVRQTLFCLIFIAGLQTPAIASNCGATLGLDFGAPLLGDQESRHLVPALLRIENGDDDRSGHGTGFLIDNENGLYLTAGHVVRSVEIGSGSTPGGRTLVGRNPQISQTPLEMKVVARWLEEDAKNGLYEYSRDIAVLQLIDPSPVHDLAPLELAFQRPRRADGFKLYGYGLSNSADLFPRPSSDAKRFDPYSPAPLYKLPTEIRGGDSGAPVYDERGTVYGIVLGSISNDWAVFHSLDHYTSFLFQQDPVARDDRLKETAFASMDLSARQSALIRLLDASPRPDGITNFEFASFISDMNAEQRLPEIPAELVECPLYYATSERPIGLKGAPLLLLQYNYEMSGLPPGQAIRSALKKAAAVEKQGNLISANAYYQVARAAADAQVAALLNQPTGQKALTASLGRAQLTASASTNTQFTDAQSGELLEKMIASLQLMSEVETPELVSENPKSVASFGSNKLAVSLHDYSLAVSGLSRTASLLGNETSADAANDATLQAATLSAAVAYSPQWKLRALDTLAVKALAVGQPELASRAYAEIWASGKKDAKVRTDFNTSIGKLSKQVDVTKSRIENFEGLNAADLFRLSTDAIPGGIARGPQEHGILKYEPSIR